MGLPLALLVNALITLRQASAESYAAGRFLKHPPTASRGAADGIRVGSRQGFAVEESQLEDVAIPLTEIPLDASLEQHGVEVIDIGEALQRHQVNESTIDVSSREMRMTIGKVMLEALEARFQRRVVHLADTSRVSGGAVYGEATVRNTSSQVLRNAHHVFHMDKDWRAISQMLGAENEHEAVRATANAHWPLVGDDLEERGLSRADYESLAMAQDPGMLNFWVALTPRGIQQHPIAVLMRDPQTGEHPIEGEENLTGVSTMPVQIKTFNDTITCVHSSVARDAAATWGFRPRMAFGQALLFYTDRTPHSAVRLHGVAESGRVSAEIRVLVAERPLRETCAISRPVACI